MRALVRIELSDPNFINQHLFESMHEITRCPQLNEKFVCQKSHLEDAKQVIDITDVACGLMKPYKAKDCRGMQECVIENHKFGSVDVVIELEDHTTETTEEYEEKLKWYRHIAGWLELV